MWLVNKQQVIQKKTKSAEIIVLNFKLSLSTKQILIRN